jgi:hypothetical protein
MRAKKIGYFLSMLLLFSAFMGSVGALPTTTVSFHGAGVTIDLTFPEEAHPTESISHNITITASTALTLYNFTVVIKAPPNTTWQTKLEENNQDLLENTNLSRQMRFTVPQNANGTLYCLIYVQSNQTTDYLSYMFFTTRVSELTFSEMQSLYNEMLANYTILQTNYTALLNDYDALLANYNSSLANYTALLSQLLANYNKLSDDYDALNANYMSKVNEYSALQVDYEELNSTRNSLLANYNSLRTVYVELNQTYTDLLGRFANLQESSNRSESALSNDRIVMFIFVITLVALVAFIIYLKRGKEEPYVVIRKETVSMNQDETRDDSNQT